MNARGSLRDTLSQPVDIEFNLGNTLRFDGSVSTVGCTSPGGHKNSHSQVSDDTVDNLGVGNLLLWLHFH